MTRVSELFRKCELQTDLGEHVAHAYLLPYVTGSPNAVIWGQRFFILHETVAEVPVYRETFCPAVFTKEEVSGTWSE